MIRIIKNINKSARFYHKRVIDHYENPRNVGSLDKTKKNVGTGLVGAPACIHSDTKIAVADKRRNVSVKTLYLENKIIKVWSYNLKKNIYEIKNARVIKNNFKKPMKKIFFDDNSFIICTHDHNFLLKNNIYLEAEKINNEFLRSFESEEFAEKCSDYNHKIMKIENLQGEFDCFDLQVEENNNFGVIINEKKNIHTGIIIKNCGDVMKIQIEVDDKGTIIDTKFKTFGCLAGDVKIATPKGYVQIKSLSVSDIVYAWNGNDIVENEIEEINIKWVNYKNLLRFEFEGNSRFKFICSHDHIWWLALDKPIEAENLNIGDELLHITENELRSRNNIGRTDLMILKVQNFMHNGLKVLDKTNITDKRQLIGLEIDNDNVKLYDIRLKEGANVFFAGRKGTHNCGSAISSSSYASELIKGKNIYDADKISNRDIAKHLSLPPVKIHCSLLVEDGIKEAIKDYKKKNNIN